MVYQKRKTSRTLAQAELRASGLTAIAPDIDFGGNRSLGILNQKIDLLRDKLNAYNTALTNVDTLRSEIKDLERSLGNLTEQMLIGVAFRFGKDSAEYQMAGGVRKRDRIRRSTMARFKAEDEDGVDAF
ncbi:MAG: hypothetical protein MJA27_21065 [Pseudanabaenales cyanobacterium]|nr:hypothetical protein [Pseudanabaenales cyanobacterium]